jgi:hypothetical protein
VSVKGGISAIFRDAKSVQIASSLLPPGKITSFQTFPKIMGIMVFKLQNV